MINTLYNLGALDTPHAFLLALIIGVGFGFALDRAGFSSSRRLAGVFYLTDMAVVKVMFTAVITALLGLSILSGLGLIEFDRLFLIPTIYGAQIVGGLLFGVGFVMGGWCPGTAASGAAAGKIDAVVFLLGAIGGSILFNELFPIIKPLYTAGDHGTQFIYENLGISRTLFVFLFTLMAVSVFWLCEWVEKKRNKVSPYLGTPFLKAFSLALIVVAGSLFLIGPVSSSAPDETIAENADASEAMLLQNIEAADDHIEPEELADRLMAGELGFIVVDVRPASEFNAFHIKGAINIPLSELAEALTPYKNVGTIALYSNGMTHPAQARDSLQRGGFNNVYLLTDGIIGFRERCLKPVSLRAEPLTAEAAERVNAWRAFFTGAGLAAPAAKLQVPTTTTLPKVVDTDWLNANLNVANVKLIDLRPQPEYNTSHIPSSLSLNIESFRGNIAGVPSLLLPPSLLSAHFSLLGLTPNDTVVLITGDKFHDATLASMAFGRLGHTHVAILGGGFAQWVSEGRPLGTVLPTVAESVYPVKNNLDDFTITTSEVLAALGKPNAVVIDVRPADYFTGKKSDEARAGHIPGAINRPFTEDVKTGADASVTFKATDMLAAAYAAIIPSKNTPIIVHCRTGHQASQTYFVLKHLLGYPNVRWYDAGWTEWSARPELPME